MYFVLSYVVSLSLSHLFLLFLIYCVHSPQHFYTFFFLKAGACGGRFEYGAPRAPACSGSFIYFIPVTVLLTIVTD
jgi:hypothetical protein